MPDPNAQSQWRYPLYLLATMQRDLIYAKAIGRSPDGRQTVGYLIPAFTDIDLAWRFIPPNQPVALRVEIVQDDQDLLDTVRGLPAALDWFLAINPPRGTPEGTLAPTVIPLADVLRIAEN